MHHVGSSVNLHVVQDGRILLLRRISKRWMDGKLQIPGGHTEPGESPLTAVLREAQEELGIILSEPDVKHIATVTVKDGDNEYFALQFTLLHPEQFNPVIMEPDKCGELVWADITNTPNDTIELFRIVADAIYSQNQTYVQVGY